METDTTTFQQALADAGHHEGKVDGVYGPEMLAAIQPLQKANGIPPDQDRRQVDREGFALRA